MSKRQLHKIRVQRTLKHFKNVQQTKAGDPDEGTVSDFLAGLKIYCEDKGIDIARLLATPTAQDEVDPNLFGMAA